ncbi:hypothetical protein M2323_000071 [Rhodoblastus acidophilus]|uniref:hypothetical protein n=1 Tax=Rhodoblastus acidophilus TaxID=1074 RepID=UPI0022243AF3|nr:hypothetical protein [Rhodoblastus acidophilus]MCW2282422.1 hypothetical protein [Rhodoblastus acidophilus]MCW2331173.1 hypothetical protein [Rhodoblastus acidophilus]
MRVVAALSILMACCDGAALGASDPCAKYVDADAYNYCLAGSGPVARSRSLGAAPRDEAPVVQKTPRVSHRATPAKPPRPHLPAGVVEKPAPKGRVRVQIILR